MIHSIVDALKKCYARILRVIPPRARVFCARAVFNASGKPFYYVDKRIHPISRFEKGVVSISIDMELAWAWRYDRRLARYNETIATRERSNVPIIVKYLEHWHIPATWAIVGHLFLKSCPRTTRPHDDMPRPHFFKNEHWDFSHGDWYDGDPCSDVCAAPTWYAPDLIQEIIQSSVGHEIACHSFSHVGFNEQYCTRNLASAELQKCLEVMAKSGVKPVSMVFPANEQGHFGLLAEYGFQVIRWFPYDWVEVSMPARLKNGLWAIPESSNIVPDETWNIPYIVWRLKRYVQKAIEKKALCHFWFHPSVDREHLENVLCPILAYCSDRRTEGVLDIMTLSDIVDRMESRKMGS